ncbi:sensor histidine kinase [Psychromicrobium xiongbiense]|uniref:sensor histidine kinase n=1 Tax=Psychromicrobium xiongbiense TaxID=3051184 RepID=UPI002552E04B|nr:ATP-binding protein [Psychromicrobium sp. YIM S02556]
MSRIALLAIAVWQGVMVWATFCSLGTDGLVEAVAQALLGLVALTGMRVYLPPLLLPLSMTAVALWSFLRVGDVDSTLTFATCWQLNFSACVTSLLILRRYVVLSVIAAALVIAGGIWVGLPEWGRQFPISIVIAQISIVVAVRLGLRALLRQSLEADQTERSAHEALHRSELVTRRGVQLAEESRVLHDTAINTLGAIANGGAGTENALRVQEQCARDVVLLRTLREARAASAPVRLSDIFRQPGLQIERKGLSSDAADRLALPDDVVQAIVGCVREAVTNATKHSGSDHIEIECAVRGAKLTVSVRDFGIGMGKGIPRGRGVDQSILARARDHGLNAEIWGTAVHGTTVRLSVDLGTSERAVSTMAGQNPLEISGALRQRAATFWAIGVTAVAVILTLGGSVDQDFALFRMIGVMVIVCVSVHPAARRYVRTVLPGVLPSVLIAGTCVVCYFAAVATGFGTVGGAYWQALAPTGPFVLLLALYPSRAVRVVGTVAWGTLVAVMVVFVLPLSVTAAQITAAAGCAGLMFSGIWVLFQRRMSQLSEDGSRAEQRAFALRLRTELERAAQSDRRRWEEAGLDAATQLLQELAEGRRGAGDADTRMACAEEERYLRQLLQISPTLVHLSQALMSAVGLARERGINFTLRLGTTDAPDQASAQAVAAAIRDNIQSTPMREKLSASLFPVHDGLQLTLVGPALNLPLASTAVARHEQLGTVDLLELTYTS